MALAALGVPTAAAAAELGCGDVVNEDTVLTADVGPCADRGLTVGADEITLDLAGHRVFGTADAGDGIGIHVLHRSGVTITGGTVSDFDAGIVIEGGGGNRIHRMAVRDNASNEETFFGDGISILRASHANVVEENLVTGNGPWDGIAVGEFDATDPSIGNVIRRNRVLNNDVRFTTGEHFTSGIVLLDVARDTVVTGNVVARNGFSGIEILGPMTSGNVIRDNQVVENGRVAPLAGDDPAGIRVGPEAFDNLVEVNRVHANGGHGVFVDEHATGNRLLDNSAQANNLLRLPDTFDLTDRNPACDANIWRRNKFLTASPPCTMG